MDTAESHSILGDEPERGGGFEDETTQREQMIEKVTEEVEMQDVELKPIEIHLRDADSVAIGKRRSWKLAAWLTGVMIVVLIVTLSAILSQRSHAVQSNFAALPDPSTRLVSLAFGSCLLQFKEQYFWGTISKASPQVMLMTGDNVYGDYNESDYVVACSNQDCVNLRLAYQMLEHNPRFREFRDKVPIVPIWDDHDLGLNDGGVDFTWKNYSEQIFLNFWQLPPSDPRWHRPGLYWSSEWGDTGSKLQLIVLDVRYFKDPFTRRDPTVHYQFPGKFAQDPNPALTMLGDEQWGWLEQELQKPADLRVVVSSLQVIAHEHGWEG